MTQNPVSTFRLIDHNGAIEGSGRQEPRGGARNVQQNMPRAAGLILGIFVMTNTPVRADALTDEIAPTGKLRVAIAISPAGGAFWSTKTERRLCRRAGRSRPRTGRETRRARRVCRAQQFRPDRRRRLQGHLGRHVPAEGSRARGRMLFGPIYEVADATYIVKAGSSVNEFHNARPARRQGRRRQQHDDHARGDRASEECQGHRLSDL